MKVYIVIGLEKDNPPQIIGVFKNKADAEKVKSDKWINIIERELK